LLASVGRVRQTVPSSIQSPPNRNRSEPTPSSV
jgi:hypothetical protein